MRDRSGGDHPRVGGHACGDGAVGAGNPEPLFVSRGFCVQSVQRVGDGSHLKLRVQTKGTGPISCIAFGLAGTWRISLQSET